MPVRSETPSVYTSTCPSSATSSTRGIVWDKLATITRTPAAASPSPTHPPASPSSTLSVSNCRMTRPGLAPSAARIAATDLPKMIRAIEVCLEAGRPMSEVHRQPRARLEGFSPIRVGLLPPRARLYNRIEKRVEAMLAAGWLDEVRGLLACGLDPAEKPFQFIGYSELRAHLGGVVELSQAVKSIQQATRRYAKRQITWFKREPGVEWFAGFGDDLETANTVLAYLAKQLQA